MSQIKIIFTETATPVSDFILDKQIEIWIHSINNHLQGQYKNSFTIEVCNITAWESLRAAYINKPRLQKNTTWWYENKQIDMDKEMKTELFWSYTYTNLLGKAYSILFSID